MDNTFRPIFLKLGGSLITDKQQTETVREAVLARLAMEIALLRRQHPTLPLLIGHGSGSFGHVHAKRYGTRDGVRTAVEWQGFALTADAAARLNRAVVGALLRVGIPAWSIQPGALLRTADGAIDRGLADNICTALAAGLVPVLFGDVVLDDIRGGTIASTEEIFEWLLPILRPRRVVLAGEVDGIYTSDPFLHPDAERISTINPESVAAIAQGLGGSHGVDVTGGMAAKVAQAIRMVQAIPGMEVVICSGLQAEHVPQAILGESQTAGTLIVA